MLYLVDYMTIIQFRSYVSKNTDLASSLSVIIARLYKIANTNPRSKSEDPELTEAREMFGHHCGKINKKREERFTY